MIKKYPLKDSGSDNDKSDDEDNEEESGDEENEADEVKGPKSEKTRRFALFMLKLVNSHANKNSFRHFNLKNERKN